MPRRWSAPAVKFDAMVTDAFSLSVELLAFELPSLLDSSRVFACFVTITTWGVIPVTAGGWSDFLGLVPFGGEDPEVIGISWRFFLLAELLVTFFVGINHLGVVLNKLSSFLVCDIYSVSSRALRTEFKSMTPLLLSGRFILQHTPSKLTLLVIFGWGRKRIKLFTSTLSKW